MKMKTTFKQVLLGEARREDLDYKEEKTKGIVDKVVTELKGSESAVATKLARRFYNLGKAVKVMEAKQKELNQQLTGMVEGVFDEVTDQVVTRVVNTASFALSVAKQEAAKEKTEVNYEAIYKQLVELVSPELEDQVKAIIDANTKRWTPDAKKPALRVKPLEEGKYTDMAKDALASVVANIKGFAKDLLKNVKLWGRTYDAKLKDLQKMAGIKKVVAEGRVKELAEEMDADELLDKFMDMNRMHSFEGSRGVQNLEKLIRVLGYRSLDDFFSDNSGAIEGVVEWIKEWTDRNDEWKEALRNEVGDDGEEVQESRKLNEARYGDSTDFEADVSKVESSLKTALKVTKSGEWNDWMKASASNYGTGSVAKSKALVAAIAKAQKELDDLYAELEDAS